MFQTSANAPGNACAHGISRLAAVRRSVFFAALAIFLPGSLLAQVVFDSAASQSSGAANVSTLSWSHTVGGGLNRMLLVGVSTRTTSVSSVSYGGQALTFIGGVSEGVTLRSEIWALANPASGTATVTVNLAASNRCLGGSVSVTGAVQNTNQLAYASANSAAVPSSPASVTVASAVN